MKPVNVFTVETRVDPDDPAGYQAGGRRLVPLIGAERIGGSIYDLPPGERVCPYHFELGTEEWLLVLTGRPVLRRADGEGEARGGAGAGRYRPLPARTGRRAQGDQRR